MKGTQQEHFDECKWVFPLLLMVIREQMMLSLVPQKNTCIKFSYVYREFPATILHGLLQS